VPEPVEGTRPYLAGLDGIRAIAVLGVIAYHLDFGWASGGLLGVEVFFVLSGYLITDLLVAEHRRSQRIDLRRFWLRRARRLLPALFVMLFVVVGWATLLDPVQLPTLRDDLPSAVFYFSNWWFIFQHVSYFAKFGPPSPLGHLWSLAIEEQFYLLWPFAVLAGLRLLASKKRRILVILGLAAASAIEMGLLYQPGGDPTRVYDGTDTRAFALLVGAALAIAWPRDLSLRPLAARARRVLEVLGVAGIVGILALFAATNEYERFLYPFGMLLCSVFTAVVIVVTIHPGARLGKVLGIGVLRWIGKRSYGIYLWSYPVIVLTTPLNQAPGALRSVLDVTGIMVLAALSWRFVEEPVRHGGLGKALERLRARRWSPRRLSPAGWLTASVALANVIICAVGLSGVVTSRPFEPEKGPTAILPTARHRHIGTTTTTLPLVGPTLPATGTHPAATTTTLPEPAGQGVTAIGDSIMIDAAPYLRQLLPGIEIDAVVGQQLYEVQAQVPRLRAEGAIGNRLILELGTNGGYSPAQLVSLLRSLGPMRRIVLVNVHVDRPWEQEVNQTIATVAKTYPHVSVVDWYRLGAEHPSYFYPDGIHLDPVGARYFAGLLAHAVEVPPPTSPLVHRPTHSTTRPSTSSSKGPVTFEARSTREASSRTGSSQGGAF
jgi:peptidoglycan/LPS O-acetylase OafA/YrhL